jgi:hypothetical protein
MFTSTLYSQSKKEQIEKLTLQLDNLREHQIKSQGEFRLQEESLNGIILDLKETVEKLQTNLTITTGQINQVNIQADKTEKLNQKLMDSLRELRYRINNFCKDISLIENQIQWKFSTGGINGANGPYVQLKVSLFYNEDELIYFTESFDLNDDWEQPVVSGQIIEWTIIDNDFGYEFKLLDSNSIEIKHYTIAWDKFDNKEKIVLWAKTFQKSEKIEWRSNE